MIKETCAKKRLKKPVHAKKPVQKVRKGLLYTVWATREQQPERKQTWKKSV